MNESHRTERPGTDERRFLTAAEVARLFEVSPNTVARWAREGKVPALVTPSGRRKFPRTQIEQLLEGKGGMAHEEGTGLDGGSNATKGGDW